MIIILSLNTIVMFLLGYFVYHQHKKNNSFKEKIESFEQELQQLAKDHPMLVHADLIFAQQIREINSQLVSMDNQIQTLENIRENDGGYQHALRILEMGGDKKEIKENCHLSNAEAELLMNLQAYRKAIGSLKEKV